MTSASYQHNWFSRPKIIEQVDELTKWSKSALYGADLFIRKNVESATQMQAFTQSLHKQLAQRIDKTNKYSFYELIAQFPFLLHPADLPAPFIVSMVIQLTNLSGGDTTFNVGSLRQMNPQVIQDLLYQGLTDSITNGQIYIAKAMQYWYQVTNAVVAMSQTGNRQTNPTLFSSNFLEGISNALKSGINKIKDTLQSIRDSMTSGFKTLTLWQYLTGIIDVDPSFAKKFAQATNKIRKYGNFLVDGWYIQNNAFRNYIDGDIYYNIPTYPQLSFRIRGSNLELYQNVQGIMRLVPETQFDNQFLIKLLKNRKIMQNAYILKQFKLVKQPVQGYAESMKEFKKEYLQKYNQQAVKTQIHNEQKKTNKYATKIKNLTLKNLDQYIKNKNSKTQQKAFQYKLK